MLTSWSASGATSRTATRPVARSTVSGVFLRGMELSETESMVPLGNLYVHVLGDDAAAEAAYRAGAELGDAHAHHNLAVLLERHGDLVGAERHFRQAAESGDRLAEAALRDLLED
jgi:TPR repeat protein